MLGGMVAASPWAFHPHPTVWVLLIALAVGYGWMWRRVRPVQRGPALCFGAGVLSLAASLTWPLGDLAAHWSVAAHIGQHIALCLICAPLLLLGLPRAMVVRLTSPEPVDRAVRLLAAPVMAALVFNTVALGAHIPVVVRADAASGGLHAVINAMVLGAGLIMWLPALRVVPGGHHLSAPGRVAYLLIQSIVPNVPAAFLTFAGAPVYNSFTGPARVLGISPLFDTQLAGALAKLVGATILWLAAAIVFFRAHRAEQTGADPDLLTWDDVERELRRAEQHSRRAGRRAARNSVAPVDVDWWAGGEAPPWERPDPRRPADPWGPADS